MQSCRHYESHANRCWPHCVWRNAWSIRGVLKALNVFHADWRGARRASPFQLKSLSSLLFAPRRSRPNCVFGFSLNYTNERRCLLYRWKTNKFNAKNSLLYVYFNSQEMRDFDAFSRFSFFFFWIRFFFIPRFENLPPLKLPPLAAAHVTTP